MAGDIPLDEFENALRRTAQKLSDYLGGVERFPVLPKLEPGEIGRALPDEPPRAGESLDSILDDYERLIEPNVTHWNHPGFMAYFAISGSGPGVIGEALAAGLNVNAMKWQSSPAATELELKVCDWLRQMIDLPETFRGHINDTASTSTLLALAAARHRRIPAVRELGISAAGDMCVYASEQAHSSVDKGAMVLGFGLDNVRHIAVNERFELRPEALADAIESDLEAGKIPLAVVATIGTTSTTSVDPVEAIAAVCGRHGLWLHIDAAYAGSAAICEEMRPLFRGWERADSIVVNPHKWLFTPVDCSVLYVRDLSGWHDAFSLVPAYLRSSEGGVDLMDLGFQLGRRFRALKLWMVIRAFGVEGLAERIRSHCAMARELAAWIDDSPDFERVAAVPFSTVCFRALAAGATPEEEDQLNEQLMRRLADEGSVFVTQTQLRGRFVLRAAIGNIKTGREHVQRLWRLLVRSASAQRALG
ncbi:MAG: pyridoxal phosphate-dependent decarboxylase family protein [Thermoanaerobaculia bacterium]